MPIHGGYSEFVCLRQSELIPAPQGVSPEAVSLILNYITAYQMLHRSAKVRPGQRVLIHGAAGGVGSALLQLAGLAGVEMYGTCSSRGASVVSELGGIPIDYRNQDFVKEIHRLTGHGVDVVFDSIGGAHIWRSRKALCPGGKVVAYGLTGSLQEGRLGSGPGGRRHRFRGVAVFALYIVGGWLAPGRKRVVPYSIQTLKRLKPDLFRGDLSTLFSLLKDRKIKPLIAQCLPLAEARHAHELLGKGGVMGKIVLVPGGQPWGWLWHSRSQCASNRPVDSAERARKKCSAPPSKLPPQISRRSGRPFGSVVWERSPAQAAKQETCR
jgi:NADPH2:quinone reductase